MTATFQFNYFEALQQGFINDVLFRLGLAPRLFHDSERHLACLNVADVALGDVHVGWIVNQVIKVGVVLKWGGHRRFLDRIIGVADSDLHLIACCVQAGNRRRLLP